MAIKKSSGSGIPFGNTAGRPANPGTGQLYSNGEAQRLELYTSGGSWENIVQEVPGVSSISGVYSEQANSGVITIYGTNFVNGAYATAIGSNGVQINAASTTYNSLVQLTATFTGLSNAQEPYDIKVTNPSNLFGIIPDALYINATPVWTTSSGSLGTFYEQVSISVSATATDSDSTITYSLASGSTLPTGVTLNSSTGVISGTLPNIVSNTTYTFTINASDGVNAVIPRTFSIASIAGSQVSGGGTVISSDATYFYRVYTSSGTFNTIGDPVNIEAVVLGGGGGGGASFGGGGGAGALVVLSSKTLTSGSYPIVVGDGAVRNTAADSVRGLIGNDSTAFGITANGGGGGGAYNNNYTGNAGGCGGGGASSEAANSTVMTGGATTQSSQSGTTFYANRGGNSFGGGPYLGTGGGGTGAQGQDITYPNGNTAGNGGAGTNAISSWLSAINSTMPSDWQTATSSGRIGGGGGGAGYQNPPTTNAGAGGAGGGANGVTGSSTPGINAIANTGSGGGGGGYPAGGGGAGGKGLVIVRYPKASTTNA